MAVAAVALLAVVGAFAVASDRAGLNQSGQAAAGSAGAGSAGTRGGGGSAGVVADHPMPAPRPSPRLRTPIVTFTRFGPSGTSQVVIIDPDGEWRFIPYRGSVRASVVNHGRLTTAEQVALAATLADPRFRAEAALAPGACRGGSAYRLTTRTRGEAGTDEGAGTDAGTGTDTGIDGKGARGGFVDASWTECDAADRPVLTDLVDRIVAAARF
jgi:hypothetical protein